MAAKPVIDQRAAEQMNLNVLKRIDPQIEELLATAGHVALYDFDIPTKRWSRKDVEGSLFLVKRRSQPRFQFIILNKKSAVAADNFVEDVHGGFQCEVQKPYVLYRNRASEVVGIWFYDDADCDRISALLQRIAATFAAPAEAAAGAGPAAAAASDLDSAAAAGGGGSGAAAAGLSSSASNGDLDFWDRQVTVTEEPGSGHPLQQQAAAMAAAHSSSQQVAAGGGAAGRPALLAPAQLHQQAPPPPPAAADAGGNDLARLFAGIKVSPAAASVAPAAAAAPQPPAPAAPLPVPVPLLTPQLLQQEAAGAASVPPLAPAAAPAAEAGAGSVLLQSLLKGSQQQQAQQAAAPPPLPHPVDISEAADRALRSKVSTLLSSLASNDAFCAVLAAELKRAGLV